MDFWACQLEAFRKAGWWWERDLFLSEMRKLNASADQHPATPSIGWSELWCFKIQGSFWMSSPATGFATLLNLK